MTEAERKAITDEYWALREEPGVLTGASLQPANTATTVRMSDGKALLTDGPFADTKEVFAGYYVLEASVLDEGPGLQNTANLFVPFFTTKPGGSGIGLVLARQIAEAHGGTLELVNRADGRGSVARMVLPLG